LKFQAYSQRYGHDINGIRPVMIPDEHGGWVSRHEAEHMAERLKLAQSRIAELEARTVIVAERETVSVADAIISKMELMTL
jgi:hypothetical protein